MDKDTLKKKIKLKFISKPNSIVKIKISKDTKLKITYMYGGKFCLTRMKRDGHQQVLDMLLDLDKLAEKILKEKVKIKTQRFFSK